MNISKPLVLCFLATAWVFAQAPQVQVTPPQVQVQAPAKAPAPAAPAQAQVAPQQAQVQVPAQAAPAPAAPAQVQQAPAKAPAPAPAAPAQVQQAPAPAPAAPAQVQQAPAKAPAPAPVAPAQVQQAPAKAPAPVYAPAQVQAPAPAPAAPVQFQAPAPVEYQAPPEGVYYQEVAEVAPPPPPPPAPTAEVPSKTIFDSYVRGNAYNPYKTVGAASTVRDLVEKPADIYGNQFFYISPVRSERTNISGYTALPFDGSSVLLGLDHNPTGNLSSWILGYANSSFGFALDYSVSKIFESDKDKKTSTRTTKPGDNIGLYVSSGTLYANASWLTYGESYSTNHDGDVPGNTTISEDYSQIEGTIGLVGKFGSSLNYETYVNAIRTGGTQTNKDGEKFVDENTFLGGSFNFDLGYIAFQSSNARVIAGSNNRVVAKFTDGVKGGKKADNQWGLVIVPNILGEFALTETLLTFAGASNSINALAGDGKGESKKSRLDIAHTDGTDAFIGLRYQKANLAFEAEVANNIFNNPLGGFNGNTMFVGFGGFVYF